jgi:hypothetical protein
MTFDTECVHKKSSCTRFDSLIYRLNRCSRVVEFNYFRAFHTRFYGAALCANIMVALGKRLNLATGSVLSFFEYAEECNVTGLLLVLGLPYISPDNTVYKAWRTFTHRLFMYFFLCNRS